MALFVLCFLLAVPAGQGGAAYEEALRLQRTGDCPRAVERYRQFLKLEPEHAAARSNLGACLASLGRYDEAIAELKLLRQSQPDDVDLALLLADCHFRLDEEKEVIAALEPLAAKHPDNRAIAYLLGRVLVRQGDVKRAQVLVERILQHGDSGEAHLLSGMAQLREAALDEAEAAFLKAVDLKPDLAAAWSQLGIVRWKRGNSTGAAEALRRALALDANDFDAAFHLGVLVRKTGRPAEARPHLEHALRLRPGSYKAQYQVGSLSVQLQEFEKARRILEALVEKAPDFPEAHTALATAYLRLGLKEQALRHREIARILLSARKSDNVATPSAAEPPEPRLP